MMIGSAATLNLSPSDTKGGRDDWADASRCFFHNFELVKTQAEKDFIVT